MIKEINDIVFIIIKDKLFYSKIKISDLAFKNLPYVRTKEQFYITNVLDTRSIKVRKKEFDDKYLKNLSKRLK